MQETPMGSKTCAF